MCVLIDNLCLEVKNTTLATFVWPDEIVINMRCVHQHPQLITIRTIHMKVRIKFENDYIF